MSTANTFTLGHSRELEKEVKRGQLNKTALSGAALSFRKRKNSASGVIAVNNQTLSKYSCK